MIALVALGNRAWGSGIVPHWVGVLLMTMGLWIGSHEPLWSIPLLFALLYFWRAWASAPWLDLESGENWLAAIERGIYAMPLVVFRVWMAHSLRPALLGFIAAFIVAPIAYYLWGRQSKVDGTAAAELTEGLALGFI